MKILIIASEMISLTGSPMYNYTLAMELKKQGHEVDLLSVFRNNETHKNLFQAGIMTITKPDETKVYDMILISQPKNKHLLDVVKAHCVINIIHSEYDFEKPILLPIIDIYVAIRPSIKEHLIKKYGIEESKIHVIYNGVDMERFSPDKRKHHSGDFIKIVLPCTIDPLREKFINYYIAQANEKRRVFIYGHKYIDIPENKYVTVSDASFFIEDHIFDADFVAGILLGRVNIEAMSMGIQSIIHNPENPSEFYQFEISENAFEARHNIKNVAASIINLFTSKPEYEAPAVVDKEAQKIFTRYYQKNQWGDKDSVSGTGSNLKQTQTILTYLPGLLKQIKIKSILDIPCGDFYWMQRIDLTGIKYTGADIVNELVRSLREKHPFEFKVLDLINSKLPKVDLILCRDLLVHFPYAEIKKALGNIKESGAKYLLTTSFPEHENRDIPMAQWRPVNLQCAPFDFPKPLITIIENCTENDGVYSDKSLCLWKVKDINV